MAAGMLPTLYAQVAEAPNAPAPAKQEDLKHSPATRQ